MISRLKRNTFIRGLYNLYNSYLGVSRKKLGYCGENVFLNPPIVFSTPQNVFLHGNNGISNAIIYTTNAKFIVKKYSGFAEGLKVSTGNHFQPIGQFYRTVTEADKPKGFDRDVIVEEDVWSGRNVTLLLGVTIGRGAIIAAGAVVNKDVPPYSVCGGVPAKFIKFKWTLEEILEHEKILYIEEDRIPIEKLKEIFKRNKRN